MKNPLICSCVKKTGENEMKKRLFAGLLALAMTVNLMSATAFATEQQEIPGEVQSVVECTGEEGCEANEHAETCKVAIAQAEAATNITAINNEWSGGTPVVSGATFVASVGDDYYTTFKEAVDAATNDEAVKLLVDITGSGIVIDKDITIDFNEKTYTVESPTVGSIGTETLGFQILKGNNVVFKNGSITAEADTAKMLIQNYADLTVTDMNLSGREGVTQYILSNNSGTVLVNGKTDITAPAGAVAFDAYDYQVGGYSGVNVTVDTTGTVTGMVEVYVPETTTPAPATPAPEEVKEAVKETVTVTEEKATVTTETIEKVIEKTEAGATVILPLTEAAEEGQAVKEAEVPVEALEKIVEEEAALTVEFEGVKVTFEAETIKAIAEQAQGSTIELRVVPIEHHELNEEQQATLEEHDVAVCVSAQIFSDGEYIGDFKGGKARIAIPFTPEEGKAAEHHKVYFVDDNGNMTLMPATYVDGHMVFETTHFSDFIIVYEETAVAEETETAVEDAEEAVVEEVQEEAGFPIIPIIVIVIVIIAAAAFFLTKKKNGKE